MIRSPAGFRMPEKGGTVVIGEGAARSGGGGGDCWQLRHSEADESIFVFSQAALLWPGQCNVSLTSVAGLSVCSLSPIK